MIIIATITITITMTMIMIMIIKLQFPQMSIQIEFACPHASDGIRIRLSTQGSSVVKCISEHAP